MRILRCLPALAIIAYLIFSPALIATGLARNPYRDWLTPEKPAWEGRIELWHIAGFKLYSGSATHYLEARAEAYEKAHAGVHIDVVGLTSAQYQTRAARGAVPDAYSFPSGLLYAEQLRQADYVLPDFKGNLAAASANGQTLAVPWLISGYFLAGNALLMAKYGLSLTEPADEAVLQNALSAGQLSIPAVLGARAGLVGTPEKEADFSAGRCALAVLDARALGDIQRSGSGNLAVSAVPLAPYTDLVQYIGAARQVDDDKAAVIADFAAFLVSDAEQERLSTLGALPVVKNIAAVYADACAEALFSACDAPIVPEPFSYQRHRDALEQEAIAAMSGDAHAKMSFLKRMAVVETGEL